MFLALFYCLVLTKLLLDDGVVCQRKPFAVNLSVTALVDQVTNALKVGVPAKDQID